jgi:hypothetical protein
LIHIYDLSVISDEEGKNALDGLTEKHLGNDTIYLDDNLSSMLAISSMDSSKSVSCRTLTQINYKPYCNASSSRGKRGDDKREQKTVP